MKSELIRSVRVPRAVVVALTGFLWAGVSTVVAQTENDARDWPMYNHDVVGTRHNPGETVLDKSTARGLEEKWRFPAKGSNEEIGVIHATPVVVNGYVYFGTTTDPTFYKLTPDGKVRWSYRRPGVRGGVAVGKTRFQPSNDGIMGSPLVTDDTVYFADTGGWIYALDRKTGAERWKRNSRAAGFPGAHPINVFFAGPFVARGKLIVAGGSLEQVVSALPFYKGNSGRGFVAALEPKTGEVIWKYDVGPKPEALKPPITIKDSFGDHVFYFGPGTSSVWSTPSFDAETGSIYFGTDVNTAPRRPTTDDPRPYTRESCAVIAIDIDKGAEKWVTQINPGDIWTNAMRSYDPEEGRYKDQAVGDTPKIYTIPVDGKPTKVVGVGCKNGGFYVFKATDGLMLEHTPLYTGPPTYPLAPEPDPSNARGYLAASAACRRAGKATDGAHRSSRTASTLCGSVHKKKPMDKAARAADGRSRGGH